MGTVSDVEASGNAQLRDGDGVLGTHKCSVLVAVLTVVFAVVCGVQVFRIGDSGARAAWGDVRYAPQTHAFQRP